MELCGEDAPGVPLLSGLWAGIRGGVGVGVLTLAPSPAGLLPLVGGVCFVPSGVSSINAGECSGRGIRFSIVSGSGDDPGGICDDTPGIGGGGCFAAVAGEGDLGKDNPKVLFASDPLPSEGGGFFHPDGRVCASSVLTEAHGARGTSRCLSREPSRRGLINGGAVRFPIGMCMFGTVPGLSALGTPPVPPYCT